MSDEKPTPKDATYHLFQFRDANKALTEHPTDWYDGKPKRCPGSGLAPAVQFHGEVSPDDEPRYLCRCPWCDKPFRPGPMIEHSFVPVRARPLGSGFLPPYDQRTRRDHIAAAISDLVADFVYYDRKGCESLPGDAIQLAVTAREVTVDEIIEAFAMHLRHALVQP